MGRGTAGQQAGVTWPPGFRLAEQDRLCIDWTSAGAPTPGAPCPPRRHPQPRAGCTRWLDSDVPPAWPPPRDHASSRRSVRMQVRGPRRLEPSTCQRINSVPALLPVSPPPKKWRRAAGPSPPGHGGSFWRRQRRGRARRFSCCPAGCEMGFPGSAPPGTCPWETVGGAPRSPHGSVLPLEASVSGLVGGGLHPPPAVCCLSGAWR